MKYYVALVISKEPIELPKNLSEDKSVQHLVVQEFQMDKDINFVTGFKNSCEIRKSAPKYCREMTAPFEGRGSSISVAILDWLRNLCKSVPYEPLYFKHEAKKSD